jgi:hypothetical protein
LKEVLEIPTWGKWIYIMEHRPEKNEQNHRSENKTKMESNRTE